MGHRLQIDQNEKLQIINDDLLLELKFNVILPTFSKWQNHTVERMWSEVNIRVNYHLKWALTHLVLIHQEELNLEEDTTQYLHTYLSGSSNWTNAGVNSAGPFPQAAPTAAWKTGQKLQ